MKYENILEVENEIKRILSKIKDVKLVFSPADEVWYSKESAALKRASMDLSMALIKMRKT